MLLTIKNLNHIFGFAEQHKNRQERQNLMKYSESFFDHRKGRMIDSYSTSVQLLNIYNSINPFNLSVYSRLPHLLAELVASQMFSVNTKLHALCRAFILSSHDVNVPSKHQSLCETQILNTVQST